MTEIFADLGFEHQARPDDILELWVDESGRVVIHSEAAQRFGLIPGARLRARFAGDELRLQRPIDSLAKVYLEPTSRCNIECSICIRNSWDECPGDMNMPVFERVVDGLKAFQPLPGVFLGGFGEPLVHPHLPEMVADIKALGGSVELITNGILLTPTIARQLIDARLDRLWVSLDGASPDSYADVRLAQALPLILANLTGFRETALKTTGAITETGVAFVALRRNLADLPALLRLSKRIGATRYLVTNLLPYTQEMCTETLYEWSLGRSAGQPSPFSPQVDLPRIDWDEFNQKALYHLLRTYSQVTLEGEPLHRSANRCPFITRSATVIAWDGEVSPCLGLMHSHTSYLREIERHSTRYSLGNVQAAGLKEIWDCAEYRGFRRRVQDFDFSPCTQCGGCDLVERNERDCLGNQFPTCGGCLWAQGVIQCP